MIVIFTGTFEVERSRSTSPASAGWARERSGCGAPGDRSQRPSAGDGRALHLLSVRAYAAFAVADAVGASGVLAVVVAGFVASWRLDLIATESRVDLYGAWDVLTFILNALMFLFVGLAIPHRLSSDRRR